MPEARAIYKDILAKREIFQKQLDVFIELAQGQRKEEALKLLVEKVRPTSLEYFALLDKLLEKQTVLMHEAASEAEQLAAFARMMMIALAAGAAVIAAVVAVLVTRSIVRPIEEAVSVARKVADGDLTQHHRGHPPRRDGQAAAAPWPT